ncbi:hypothetical protein ASG52_09365 [Methylobacterium sp. Leaf456]|uniref:hypothetical protein n=1 Tax=Methylobacterium sp. Leaf456 TaxID=1736382 RepID=UPI0007012CE1|nr:hypothetical protein [Methylobacterium sp. Leaf456]KQT49170.1 hypothetical protein ASG52_09365 [Methylobacterium sp. Leaf456]
MTRIVLLGTTVAAALLAGSLLGTPAWAQQQSQTGAGTAPAPKPATTGACRVTDYVGGRTCTGDVPESVCAAIAREAKGRYTWTNDECP